MESNNKKNKKIINSTLEVIRYVRGNFYNNKFIYSKQPESINSFLSLIFNDNPEKVNFVIDNILFKDIHILINTLVAQNIQGEITFILNDIFIPDKKNTERDKWLDEYTIYFPYGKEYTHNDVTNKLLNNYVKQNNNTVDQEQCLKIRVQLYAQYSIFYNFISEIGSINYEKTEQEIDKQIDEILDSLYKEVDTFNKKYQELSSDYLSSSIITSSDIRSLKKPFSYLIFYIKRYVYKYEEKSAIAITLKKQVVINATTALYICVLFTNWSLFAVETIKFFIQFIVNVTFIAISSNIALDDIEKERQLIQQTKIEIDRLINDRYFLILAQNLGNKMTILLEYEKSIRGSYAYIEDTGKLFMFNVFNNQDSNLDSIYFSMQINNDLYGKKDNLCFLKHLLSKKFDDLEEKSPTSLQPIHSKYMEIYETLHKDIYEIVFRNFTNLVYIETPHFTTNYINSLFQKKKQYRKNKKTHTYMNMVVFTNSLDMQKAGFVRNGLQKTLDVKAPHLAFDISTYHKKRNYAALDYQEYDLLVNKERTLYKSQVMFFSCFKYVKADEFFNSVNRELMDIYNEIKKVSVMGCHKFRTITEQYENTHIEYDKNNQYNKHGINVYYKEIGYIYNKINHLSSLIEKIKVDTENKDMSYSAKLYKKFTNELQSIQNKFIYFANIYNKANITKEELISVLENAIKIQFQYSKSVYQYITNKDDIELSILEQDNPKALYENNCINSLHFYFKYSIFLYHGLKTDTDYPILSTNNDSSFNDIVSLLNNELKLIFGEKNVHQLVTNIFNGLLLSTVLIYDISVEKYQIKNIDKILNSLQQIVVEGVGERYFYEKSVFEKSIFSETNLSFNELVNKDYNTIVASLTEPAYIIKQYAKKLFVANEFYYIISLIINFIEQENSFLHGDQKIQMINDYKEFYEYKNKLYQFLSDKQDEKFLQNQPSFFEVWFNYLLCNNGKSVYEDCIKYFIGTIFANDNSSEDTTSNINDSTDNSNISYNYKIKSFNYIINNRTELGLYLPVKLTSADMKGLAVGSLLFNVNIVDKFKAFSIDLRSFITGLIVTYMTKLIDMVYARADKDSIEYSNKLLSYYYVDNTVLPPHTLINNNMVCTPVEINNNFSIFDMVHLIFGDRNMDINFLLDSYSLYANIKEPDLCYNLFKQRIKTVLTGYGIKGLHNQLLEEYRANRQYDKEIGAFYAWNYIAKKHKEQKEDEPLGINIGTIKQMLGLKDEKLSNIPAIKEIKINGNIQESDEVIDIQATTVAKSFYQSVCYAEGYRPDFDLVPKKIKYVENSAKQYEKRNSLFVESLYEIARQNFRSAYMQVDNKEFKDEYLKKQISVNQQPFIGIITLWVLPQNLMEG